MPASEGKPRNTSIEIRELPDIELHGQRLQQQTELARLRAYAREKVIQLHQEGNMAAHKPWTRAYAETIRAVKIFEERPYARIQPKHSERHQQLTYHIHTQRAQRAYALANAECKIAMAKEREVARASHAAVTAGATGK